MINGRSLKQHDFPVALGITHLTTAAFLLSGGEFLPSWVTSYSYFTALTCIVLCLIFKPHKGFLTGLAVAFAITVMTRAINMSLVSLHGPGVDYLLGLMMYPISWILGTPAQDAMLVGQLLGKKTIINEFVAYQSMEAVKEAGLFASQKSIIIATYALCGFANFASIGIQIGGIGALAPGQRQNLARFGVKALIGGTIAAFMTAVIAGTIV